MDGSSSRVTPPPVRHSTSLSTTASLPWSKSLPAAASPQASWRSRWKVRSAPATSRPASDEVRPSSRSPSPPACPVDQIDRFAGPVLAEREYMCEQARKTTIRRKHVGGAGVLLGVLVNENIAADGGVPESAAWDSWRREDGRWTVTVTPAGEQPASFLFDVKSRYVVPADEFAHGLVGDVALPDSADMAIADAVRVPSRKAPSSPRTLVEEIIDEVEQVTEASDVEDTGGGSGRLVDQGGSRPPSPRAARARRRGGRAARAGPGRARGRLRRIDRARCCGARHDGPTQEAPRTSSRPQLGRDHVRRQID